MSLNPNKKMKMENIKLSIILPVYNAEKEIERCIKSIVSEDIFDFELIIINDGSTDNSDFLIRKYISDNRIRYISQDNCGVSSARNIALSNAHGELICFIDADDYIVPGSLSTRINVAKDCDLTILGYYIKTINGECIDNEVCKYRKQISKQEAFLSLTPETSIGYQGYLWNKVFRRDIIEKYNISFDPEIAYGEDRLFVGQYIQYCSNIKIEPIAVYYYVKSNSSAMSEFGKLNNKNIKKMLTELDGLEKLRLIFLDFDRISVYAIEKKIFFTCIKFARNANSEVKEEQKYCIKKGWIYLRKIILFPNNYYSIRKKIEAIGRMIVLR